MSYVIILLAIFFGLFVALRLLLHFVRKSPQFRAEMERHQASREAEESITEAADWFGSTGLSDEVERELPKYLRREFGERVLEPGSLKAADLIYIGRFEEQDFPVHYWKIPSSDGKDSFAYVEEWADGQCCTGWGNRQPPTSAPSIA